MPVGQDAVWSRRIVNRLRFAFAMILIFIVWSEYLTVTRLLNFSREQSQLIDQSVPVLSKSQEFARVLATFLQLTGRLRSDLPLHELQDVHENFSAQADALHGVIATPVFARAAKRQNPDLEKTLDELISTTEKLFGVQISTRNLEEDVNKAVDQFVATHSSMKNQIETMILDASTQLHKDADALETGSTDALSRHVVVRDADTLNALLAIDVHALALLEVIKGVARGDNITHFGDVRSRLVFDLNSITQILLALDDAEAQNSLAALAKEMSLVIDGPGGLASLEVEYNQLVIDKSGLLKNQATTVNTLSDMMRVTLEWSEAEIAKTAIKSREFVASTQKSLALTAIFAILGVVLIDIIFVERQINRRMSKLMRAVREIAGGKYHRPVALVGDDEIGDIAKALEIFRLQALELVRSNEDLRKFAYVASHDLASPLTAIHSLAKWTLEDAGSELSAQNRQNLELLIKRADRLSTLQKDLLNYAVAGEEKADISETDLKKTIAEISEMIDPEQAFDVTVGPGQETVRTYSVPLRQILMNLITNAIKHHDRSFGTITVSAHSSEGRIHFAVADDGPGIEKRYQKKVFDLFHTLKSRDEVEGSGMGLAIVSKLATRYGGKVDVSSEPDNGRGTEFTFDFPDCAPAGEVKTIIPIIEPGNQERKTDGTKARDRQIFVGRR